MPVSFTKAQAPLTSPKAGPAQFNQKKCEEADRKIEDRKMKPRTKAAQATPNP
jgi:hypothetical protein